MMNHVSNFDVDLRKKIRDLVAGCRRCALVNRSHSHNYGTSIDGNSGCTNQMGARHFWTFT